MLGFFAKDTHFWSTIAITVKPQKFSAANDDASVVVVRNAKSAAVRRPNLLGHSLASLLKKPLNVVGSRRRSVVACELLCGVGNALYCFVAK